MKLANKKFYKTNISKISFQLSELQKSDKKAEKIKTKGLKIY